MICSKCNSNNTRIELIQEKMKHKDRSFLVRIGRMFLILCTCGMWFLVPKRKGTSKIKSKKMLICNECGHIEKVD